MVDRLRTSVLFRKGRSGWVVTMGKWLIKINDPRRKKLQKHCREFDWQVITDKCVELLLQSPYFPQICWQSKKNCYDCYLSCFSWWQLCFVEIALVHLQHFNDLKCEAALSTLSEMYKSQFATGAPVRSLLFSVIWNLTHCTNLKPGKANKSAVWLYE